jgi:hypothetical protein
MTDGSQQHSSMRAAAAQCSKAVYIFKRERKGRKFISTFVAFSYGWFLEIESSDYQSYHPSRKLGSRFGGGAAYCGGAITGGPLL